MECKKKSFDSITGATIRALEINKDNEKYKKRNKPLRGYKCEYCDKYHLTSMDKHTYKFKMNIDYRNYVRERSFIKRETEHWNQIFGID